MVPWVLLQEIFIDRIAFKNVLWFRLQSRINLLIKIKIIYFSNCMNSDDFTQESSSIGIVDPRNNNVEK